MVGLAGTRSIGPSARSRHALLLPAHPQDYGFVKRYARLFPLHVVVRGDGDRAATARAMVAALGKKSTRGCPPIGPKSMVEQLGSPCSRPGWPPSSLRAFGGLGLLLASLGVYGVVAYSVAERTQEMGVRIALGASGRDVLGLVLRDGLRLTAWGVAVGAVLAAGLAQALRTLLYGLSTLDPTTFVLVPLLLTGSRCWPACCRRCGRRGSIPWWPCGTSRARRPSSRCGGRARDRWPRPGGRGGSRPGAQSPPGERPPRRT